MKIQNKPIVAYVPHGIDSRAFFPITETMPEYEKVEKLRLQLFGDKNTEIDFILFFNSRNIRRKMIPDIILAYKIFCDTIGKESGKKCALLLHTTPIDENGTNLLEVIEHVSDPDYTILFTGRMVDVETLNQLYNIADVTVCIGSNEGWGLSCTESLMAGTPVIANVTGGLQDQMRFEDENGKWIDFTAEFPSNHAGKYKKHGIWAIPVFPSNRSIQGSIPTPYIFDDRVAFEDLAVAIKKWYNTKPDFRETAGLLGREWLLSAEANMSTDSLADNMIKCIDATFDNWKPRLPYVLMNTANYKFIPSHNGVLVDFEKLVK